MSIVTMPSNLPVGVGMAFGQRRYDASSVSDANGTLQARLLGPPRWTLTLVSPENMSVANAGAWMAMVLQLRGRVNVLSAYDLVRPVPRGTLGTGASLALSGTHSQGATSLTMTVTAGFNGTTLIAGDWLQVATGLGSSQLVMVMAAATVSANAITVTVEPPLRAQYAGATAVAWNRPLGYYRSVSENVSWTYANPRVVQGMGLDLLECWN